MPRTQSFIVAMMAQIDDVIQGKSRAQIGEFVKEVDDSGIFDDPAFQEKAMDWFKRELVRRVLRRKGEDNYPLFPNLVINDAETGKPVRVYMRERFMKPPHYQQVAGYWAERDKYARWMSNETIRRCNRRYRMNLATLFPEPPAETK